MTKRFLTALPVFNEKNHVTAVLDEVRRYAQDILVVDDGSSDGTAEILATRKDIQVVHHTKNLGYGAALMTAFRHAERGGYEYLVTIDCDGQHEPQRIPQLVAQCADVDIVSGSRYLTQFERDSIPPAERRAINFQITQEINEQLGLNLTDAFCGFKAYRVSELRYLHAIETGYAMPLELWVLAAKANLRIVESPVPLIYLDEKRSFGGQLDDGRKRLEYYRQVIERTIARTPQIELPVVTPSCCGMQIN